MWVNLWNRNSATPLATALLVLLLLVIAAQFVAMTTLVQGQVDRAQLLECARTSASLALRNCSRASSGRSADDCMVAVTVASVP